MKEHLSNSIQALINGDTAEAKKHFSVYIKTKTKAMLEEKDMEPGLVAGHCDACGEETTITKRAETGKQFTCPKCGGHEFVRGK